MTTVQKFMWDNLTIVTATTNAYHSTVTLSSPSLNNIYLWHVKSNTASLTMTQISNKFKGNGFEIPQIGSLLLESDGN